jgi:hypothetical protein
MQSRSASSNAVDVTVDVSTDRQLREVERRPFAPICGGKVLPSVVTHDYKAVVRIHASSIGSWSLGTLSDNYERLALWHLAAADGLFT